jgi:hypothetical protein
MSTADILLDCLMEVARPATGRKALGDGAWIGSSDSKMFSIFVFFSTLRPTKPSAKESSSCSPRSSKSKKTPAIQSRGSDRRAKIFVNPLPIPASASGSRRRDALSWHRSNSRQPSGTGTQGRQSHRGLRPPMSGRGHSGSCSGKRSGATCILCAPGGRRPTLIQRNHSLLMLAHGVAAQCAGRGRGWRRRRRTRLVRQKRLDGRPFKIGEFVA